MRDPGCGGGIVKISTATFYCTFWTLLHFNIFSLCMGNFTDICDKLGQFLMTLMYEFTWFLIDCMGHFLRLICDAIFMNVLIVAHLWYANVQFLCIYIDELHIFMLYITFFGLSFSTLCFEWQLTLVAIFSLRTYFIQNNMGSVGRKKVIPGGPAHWS